MKGLEKDSAAPIEKVEVLKQQNGNEREVKTIKINRKKKDKTVATIN